MMKVKSYLIILIAFTCIVDVHAQVPLNNPNFSIKTFDDFDSWTSSAANWCPLYECYSHKDDDYVYEDDNIGNNIIFSSTGSTNYVSLKVEKLATPISYDSELLNYKSGVLQSHYDSVYKFGYFEIRARLPQGASVHGVHPGFWLYNSDESNCWYNEIDIVENGGGTTGFGNLVGYNMHSENSSCTGQDSPFSDADFVNGGIPVSADLTDWHKYSVFWEPNKVTYYFDGNVLKEFTDVNYIPTHPMWVILNLTVDPWIDTGTWFPDPAVLPAYFDIDYYQLKQLNTDCTNTENVCNFNYSTFDFRLKKSISIGGSGCSSAINLTDNVALMATDFVLLDVGTTINNNNGSGSFTAYITPCPN